MPGFLHEMEEVKNYDGNCNRLGAMSFRRMDVTIFCEKKTKCKQKGFLVSLEALKRKIRPHLSMIFLAYCKYGGK